MQTLFTFCQFPINVLFLFGVHGHSCGCHDSSFPASVTLPSLYDHDTFEECKLFRRVPKFKFPVCFSVTNSGYIFWKEFHGSAVSFCTSLLRLPQRGTTDGASNTTYFSSSGSGACRQLLEGLLYTQAPLLGLQLAAFSGVLSALSSACVHISSSCWDTSHIKLGPTVTALF